VRSVTFDVKIQWNGCRRWFKTGFFAGAKPDKL